MINLLEVVDYFKDDSKKETNKIEISKRINSYSICAGKLLEEIYKSFKTVSICGQELKTLQSKKIMNSGDHLSLGGKLLKGTILFKVETERGEEIFKTISKKGNFNFSLDLPRNDYFKLEVISIVNAYNFPEIKFEINSAIIY